MPCHNNATCINQLATYSCECPLGYTDKNCSTDIDDCNPNRCQNNGNCIDRVNGFDCECLIGFAGKFCGESKILFRYVFVFFFKKSITFLFADKI